MSLFSSWFPLLLSAVAAGLPRKPAEADLPVRCGPRRPGPGLPRRLFLVRPCRQPAETGVAWKIPQIHSGTRKRPSHPSPYGGIYSNQLIAQLVLNMFRRLTKILSKPTHLIISVPSGLPKSRSGNQPDSAAHKCGVHLRLPCTQVCFCWRNYSINDFK